MMESRKKTLKITVFCTQKSCSFECFSFLLFSKMLKSRGRVIKGKYETKNDGEVEGKSRVI